MTGIELKATALREYFNLTQASLYDVNKVDEVRHLFIKSQIEQLIADKFNSADLLCKSLSAKAENVMHDKREVPSEHSPNG